MQLEYESVDDLFDEPPEAITIPKSAGKPWLSRRNRRLGRLGEQFTLEIETGRLLAFGRDDLAAGVESVAETCGAVRWPQA